MHDTPPSEHQLVLPPRRTMLIFCGGILALALVVFGRSLGNGFVAWDDLDVIQGNPIVRTMNLSTIGQAFTSFDPELYAPLTMVSLQIDDLIGGGSPFLFHLTNILLHALNALLVAWFAWLLLRKRELAAIVAILFLVHPIHTEAVAWASARKDLLSSAFFLLACIAYLTGWRWRLALVFAAFLLGLLSKVSIVVLPIMLLLIDWWQERTINGERMKEKIPLFALALIFGIVALLGKQHVLGVLSPLEIFLLIPKATVFLLGKLFVPIKLAIFYPYTDPISLQSTDLLAHAGLFGAILIVGWLLCRRARELLWGFLFFCIAIVPNVMNFAKGERLGDIYLGSDRFAYIGSVGVLITVVSLIDRLVRGRSQAVQRAFVVMGSIVTLLFAAGSFGQVGVWRTTETLFVNVLRHYPNSQEAHGIVAGSLYAQGRLEEAVQGYAASIQIRPTARSFFNLGVIFLDADNYQAAIDANLEALKLDPQASSAQMNIGVAYLKQKKFAEASAAFQRTIAMEPKAGAAYVNFGGSEEELGHWEEARRAYEKALEVQPDLKVAAERLATLDERRSN